GPAAATGLDEPVPLVELQSRVVRLDAQADRSVALRSGFLEQSLQEFLAVALAAAAGHDRDGQLGRLLVDEPVPRPSRREQPVPRRSDGLETLDLDHGRVSAPSPTFDVPRERDAGRLVTTPACV